MNISAIAVQTLPPDIILNLSARYREPHRHYHGMRHVEALLSWLLLFRHCVSDVPAVKAAIWFHDAIYEPQRADNEARSADLARRLLIANAWTRARVDRVVDLVLATQTHECDDNDTDKALFLDLDLSILAADRATYDTYARNVRLEYGHVDAASYRSGRCDVLRYFLSRRPIYRTQALSAIWEAAARANLLREMARLGSLASAVKDDS